MLQPRSCCRSSGLDSIATLLAKLTIAPCTASRLISLPKRHAQRTFTSSARSNDWLTPKKGEKYKSRTGRPRVATGGSTRGTTVVWGDYGLRLKSHGMRISAKHLKIAEEAVKKRLRGEKYRLYHRVAANIGVYTSGNEQRMGKGKGSFDYWATRMAVSRILFEVKGNLHEQVVRDAFRLAGNKLPGIWEFAKKGDPPVMGITKIEGTNTREFLLRPRVESAPGAVTKDAISATLESNTTPTEDLMSTRS